MQDPNTLMRQLLEAGVHFGHQTNRWNPKMEKYIFGDKNGIYIIDLQKTVEGINKATTFLRNLASKGECVLFVGTKKQAQHMVKEQAVKCQMPYVTQRWLGGALTNFATIRKSIKRLEGLEKLKEDGTYDLLKKKERAQITKQHDKLMKNLEGIRAMAKLPKAIFVVDSKAEIIAVKEANKLSIPVVAIVDTNSDPDKIDYVIPGNDDAIRAIELITQVVAESVLEGRQKFLKGTAASEIESALESVEIKTDDEEVEKLKGDDKKEEVKEERIKKKPKKKPAKK